MKREEKHHPFFHQIWIHIRQCELIASSRELQPERHVLNAHTLWFALKGRGELYIDNRPSDFVAKTAFVLAPGTVAELRGDPSRPLTVYRLSFDVFRLTERSERQLVYDKELSFPVKGKFAASGASRTTRLLRKIADFVVNDPDADPLLYQQDVRELFRLLLDNESDRLAEYAGDPIQRTLRHMQHQYASDITLQSLARIAGTHPAYYSALFKRKLGRSPIDYLTRLRINRAKELMLASPDKLRNIARLTGFGDEFYFSRRFKAYCGMAPTAYMKKRPHAPIASLSLPYTDHLLALGVEPCEVYGHGELLSERKWGDAGAYENWETSRKALLRSKPDLILCKEHIIDETRKHMGDIAPIVTIPWLLLDCFDHMREIAKLTGKETAARAWIERHEGASERARRQVARTTGKSTIAICVVAGDKLKMYGGRNIGHVFYRSLQLTPPGPIVREMAKYRAGTVFNWMPVGPEQFSECEADYLAILVQPQEQAIGRLAELQASEAWRRHPAVRDGRVLALDWNKWSGYSPYSISRQLDEAVTLLSHMHRR
ncbi:helix-turn-helix domain-containing protein [Paenibacillus hodogayensis]|uniref:Helix-turn-helix domain-containing protein n=1 Tax=Paenibacillus hodogayensis TaxID=279208 RepID=A0ABV5VT17_9BACL